MQIMPQTGAELKVGDIRVIDSNIHGGAKYLDRLMSTAFPDAHFDEVNRTLFAFASYNCGPDNVAKARTEARKRGLDPDRWFSESGNAGRRCTAARTLPCSAEERDYLPVAVDTTSISGLAFGFETLPRTMMSGGSTFLP